MLVCAYCACGSLPALSLLSTSFFGFSLLLQSFQDHIRSHRDAVKLDSNRVGYRIHNGRCGRQLRSFTGLLGPEGAQGVIRINVNSFHLRHLHHSREAVVEKRRVVLLTIYAGAVFIQRLAHAPYHAPLQLTLHKHGIDGLAAVMRGDHLDQLHLPGLQVYFNLSRLGHEGVIGAEVAVLGQKTCGLLHRRRPRSTTHYGNRTIRILVLLENLLQGDTPLRVIFDPELPVGSLHIINFTPQVFSHNGEELLPHVVGGGQSCVARADGDPGAKGAGIQRTGTRICSSYLDILHGHPQLFRDNLADDSLCSLTYIRRSRQNIHSSFPAKLNNRSRCKVSHVRHSGRKGSSGQSHSPTHWQLPAFLLPAYGLCRFHHTIAKAARIDDEACGMLLTLLDGISYPDIHRIYANPPSDEVQLPFNSEPCRRDTVTTHCSTHRLVRIDMIALIT